MASEIYELPEFLEFMNPAKLAIPEETNDQQPFVFWSEETDGYFEANVSTQTNTERIKRVLKEESAKGIRPWALVQFWALKHRHGKRHLTTSDQPFSILELEKGACLLKKECMKERIDLLSDEDVVARENLGPIVRSFFSRTPETTPDVGFYSLQEFPHRKFAIDCGLTELLVLPVFERKDKSGSEPWVPDELEPCVGVLECLNYHFEEDHPNNIDNYLDETEEEGLALSHGYFPIPDEPLYPRNMFTKIRETMDLVASEFPLVLALAFVQVTTCREFGAGKCSRCSLSGRLRLAASYRRPSPSPECYYKFVKAQKLCQLRMGKGVAGKAFESSKSSFCKDLRNLSVTEYPLVYHAQHAHLTSSFAVFLQDYHTNIGVVLEFFLLPSDNHIHDNTRLLIRLMQSPIHLMN